MSDQNCGSLCVEQPQAQAANDTSTKPVQITPRADVWEAEDAYLLTVEMPGVGDADADVTLEKNVLTVRGLATPFARKGSSRPSATAVPVSMSVPSGYRMRLMGSIWMRPSRTGS